MQGAVPAPHIITGCDLLPVGPLGFGIQVESDDATFVAKLPALGDARLGLQRDGVFDREALEQRTDNVVLGYAGDHVGVKALRLGAVAVVQHTVAVAGHYIALTAAAGSE